LEKVKKKDFVYLDPPYASDTKSFVSYNEKGFDEEAHNTLFKTIQNLKSKFLLSNADVKLVRESFPESEYKIEVIVCRRAINSKDPGDKAKEILIKNY
jgi:DNA adenine methylase